MQKSLIKEDYNLFKMIKSYTSSDSDVQLKIDRKERYRLVKNQDTYVNIAIPLTSTTAINLELKKVDLFTEDFQWNLSSGEPLEEATSQHVAYRGIVNGDHGSLVSLVVTEAGLKILISDVDGNYRVIRSRLKSEDDYMLYIEPETQLDPTQCGTGVEQAIGERPTNEDNSNPSIKAAGDIVEIYFECDKALYDRLNGTAGVQSYLTALFAEIKTLYANEGITVQMSSPLIWNTNDPYISTNDVRTLLDKFGNVRKNNYSGRLAALLSGREINGIYTGGIAWVGVLCATYGQFRGDSGPYSINYNVGKYNINRYPNYSLEVSIITHELGHNFGSQHTQDCYWGPNGNQSIDNCVRPSIYSPPCTTPRLVSNPEYGTMMSYCRNIDFTKGFGTEPGALIYNRYVSANCLVAGGNGSGNGNDCTHTNRTFNGGTIDGGTEVRASNNVNFQNTVNVSSGGTVSLSAENTFNIYGTLTVPRGSEVEMNNADCN